MLGTGSTMPSAVSSADADAYGPARAATRSARSRAPTSRRREPGPDAGAALPRQSRCLRRQEHEPAEDGKDPADAVRWDEFADCPRPDARKEVIAQARDWNAYREQLAIAAGQAPAEAAAPAEQSAAGKAAPTVEDKGAQGKEAPKEVLEAVEERARRDGRPAAGGSNT